MTNPNGLIAEEHVQYLCAASNTDCFDLRIFFDFMTRATSHEMRQQHSDWTNFARTALHGVEFVMQIQAQTRLEVMAMIMPSYASFENGENVVFAFNRQHHFHLRDLHIFLTAIPPLATNNTTYENGMQEQFREAQKHIAVSQAAKTTRAQRVQARKGVPRTDGKQREERQ